VHKLFRLLEALTGEIHHRPILGLLGVLVMLAHLWVVLLLLQPTDENKPLKPIKIMEVALVKEPPPKTEDTPPAPPKPTPPKIVPPKKKAVIPPPVMKKTPIAPKQVEQPKLKPQKVGDEQIPTPSFSRPTQSPSMPTPALPSAAVSKPANKSGNGEAKSKGINSGVIELGCPKPKYPNRAMSRHIEGSVKIALTISAAGTVINASVASAQPPGIFDDVALDAAKRCKFKPKIVNGNPVQLKTSKSFRFSLEN
jgi:periplasmic protein TonB